MWSSLNLFCLIALVHLVYSITEPDQLSNSDIQKILDKHNELRAKVSKGEEISAFNQPAAKNMNKLLWDPALAKVSEGAAKKCIFEHNDERGNDLKKNEQSATFTLPGGSRAPAVGENIYGTSQAPEIEDIKSGIQAWYDEIKDYTFNTGACSGVCGHYTQVVWANTRYVGCAFYSCKGSGSYSWMDTIFFCNYYPAGNYYGQKPYQVANVNNNEVCTNCDGDRNKCEDGLCAGGVCNSFNANNNQMCSVNDCDDGTGRDICSGSTPTQQQQPQQQPTPQPTQQQTQPTPEPTQYVQQPSPVPVPSPIPAPAPSGAYYDITILANINWETDWATLTANGWYVYYHLFSLPKDAVKYALNVDGYGYVSPHWNYRYNQQTQGWEFYGNLAVTLDVHHIPQSEYDSILSYINTQSFQGVITEYIRKNFGNAFKISSVQSNVHILNTHNMMQRRYRMEPMTRRNAYREKKFLIL